MVTPGQRPGETSLRKIMSPAWETEIHTCGSGSQDTDSCEVFRLELEI